jgi:ADP-heptose:LPS heptosyltransferase
MSNQIKVVARKALPTPIYNKAHQLRVAIQKAFDSCRATGVAAYTGLPDLVISLRDFGLGDNLLCTAILRELHQRKRFGVWMMSDYPELFAGMNDAERVVPANDKYKSFMRVWRPNIPNLMYAPLDSPDHDVPPRRHIITEFCARAGITGSIALRPYLKLTSAEKAQESWACGRVVIQSSVLGAKYPMLNKQWDVKRFQQVVDTLCNEFELVQLGSPSDPALEHVKDLRGITGIRQSAAILHNARLFIGGVGFLMHLARAVECPSVIVYGGREAPWQSGYICNANLYTALSCAPCWRWNTCDFDRKCMRDIEGDDVVRGVRELLSKPKAVLPVEHAHIG